ncbi:MAG TPA: hypothetical protein VMS55_14650 [Myxococcota bacterium]|nr:hypothetical protein [Myxococcota bacterium]
MSHIEPDPDPTSRDDEPLGAADEFDRREQQGERGERRRKERILHTRISEDLADDLRRVAEDLRVPVSNLVRNVLEEAFSVVESVTGNVGELIEEVMDEAEAVRARLRGRQRRRSRRMEAEESPREAEAPPPRDDEVIGWQPLVLARPQRCARCGILMGRGDSAYASVTPKGVGASWRCEDCPVE